MNELLFNIQNLETKVENTLLDSLEKKIYGVAKKLHIIVNRHGTEM